MQETPYSMRVLLSPALAKYFAESGRKLQWPIFQLMFMIWRLEKENATEAMWTSQLGALASSIKEWRGGNSP